MARGLSPQTYPENLPSEIPEIVIDSLAAGNATLEPQNESTEDVAQPESDMERRDRVLCSVRHHLWLNRYKSWEEQVLDLPGGSFSSLPYAEPLSEDSLEESMARVARSRSVDLSLLSREKYLSRWSRENTPSDSVDRFERHLRRSYTPLREIGSYKGAQVVEDTRRPYSAIRHRTPLSIVTVPYHTNVNYRSESEPLRKYDVFQLRSWSYPIYKYIHRPDTHSTRPYSLTRALGMTPAYTPPQLTAELKPITTRRGYSGYSYLASETNYDVTSRPRSLKNTSLWKPCLNVSPYFSHHYGSSSLRHFNSYRPRPYYTRIPSYYAPYY